jgi:hypothetical protein
LCELGLLYVGILLIIDSAKDGARETFQYVALAVASLVTTVVSFIVNLVGSKRLLRIARESIRITGASASASHLPDEVQLQEPTRHAAQLQSECEDVGEMRCRSRDLSQELPPDHL